MDLERKRVGGMVAAAKNGSIASSVWETRMKSDDLKGGFKVFNSQPNSLQNHTNKNNNEIQVYKRLRHKQSVAVLAAGVNAGKRKTWNSDYSNGTEKIPVQISKQRPEKEKNSEEKRNELGVSGDGIKKIPVQFKKMEFTAGKELCNQSVDGFDKSPIHRMRTRAMWQRLSIDSGDRDSISLRNLKSAPSNNEIQVYNNVDAKSEENGRNSVEFKKSAESLEEFGVGLHDS